MIIQLVSQGTVEAVSLGEVHAQNRDIIQILQEPLLSHINKKLFCDKVTRYSVVEDLKLLKT